MNTKAFLQEVIEDLISRYGLSRLGELTIVVPSRRAALSIKEYIKSAVGPNQVVQLPRMITLIDLQNSLSTLYVADEVYLVTTLYRVYQDVLKQAKAGTHTSLATFYAWGSQLIQDFSGIDKAYPIVEPDKFLSNTAEARELEQLDIDSETRERLLDVVSNVRRVAEADSKRAVFTFLWQHLGEIYHRLQTALGDRSYEGARMRDVLVNWDSDYVQSRLDKHYVFAGFNYLVPAEQELMQKLKDMDRADFYWEYPTDFTANTHAFRWVKRNAERFGNRLEPHSWQGHKPVTIISASSSTAQSQYVYSWLQEHHHQGEKSAVVICDEQMLEPVIYALPDGSEDTRFEQINITKGFPIKRTTVFAEIIAWLSDYGNDAAKGESYATVLLRLRDFIHSKINQSTNQPINQLSWHQLLRGESLYQAHVALAKLYDSLLTENIFAEITNLRTLRLLVRRYLESISFPFHGEPLTQIQVTGMLETRALDFDNLLILNVEEGIVPNAVNDKSYIPFYLRKYYGLQTHEEATDVYAYNFFRLISRAAHVTVMFAGAEGKSNRKSMSRFIRQMMMSDDFNVKRLILTEHNALLKNEVALFDPDADYPLPSRLSPSAINTYITCPMKFYLRYIIGIDEPLTFEPLYERNEIGSLTHETMRHLYRSIGFDDRSLLLTPALLERIDDKMINKALALAERSLNDDLHSRHPELKDFIRFNSAEHPIETAVVIRYVKQIVAADLKLASSAELVLMALEQNCYMTIDIPGKGSISTGGQIDRVDKVNGVLRIVDYKTGKGNSKKLSADSVQDIFAPNPDPTYLLQTMLYCAAWSRRRPDALNSAIQPVIYFPGRKTDDVIQPLKIDKAEVRFNDWSQQFIDGLSDIISTILTPAVPTQLQDKCSSFCPFLTLCNRKPQFTA